jgi:hypothetical protein
VLKQCVAEGRIALSAAAIEVRTPDGDLRVARCAAALHHQHLGQLVESTQPSRTRRAAATPPTMITFMMSLGFGLS